MAGKRQKRQNHIKKSGSEEPLFLLRFFRKIEATLGWASLESKPFFAIVGDNIRKRLQELGRKR